MHVRLFSGRAAPTARRSKISAAILTAAALTASAAVVVANAGKGFGAEAAAAPVSPLLFGENLDLFAGTAGSDWFLSHPALRTGLANVHAQIIRLPVRGPSPSSSGIANLPELEAALQDVKTLGFAPLIILRNPQDPSLLADDTQVVNYATSLFGAQPVYYEWANETDLSGSSFVSAAAYLASWNANVPKLKATAGPGAQFIGPANYQYDPSYLQTFLAGANPLPDAISWHSYTCNDSTASESTCLGNIDHWTADYAAARTLMSNTIHTQLPIWITEWNYTPTIDGNDSKHTDTAFLQQWTTKALQTLAAGGIAASMHFNVNNLGVPDGSLPLVNFDGSPAPEGVAFSAAYNALVGSGSTSSPSPSTSPSASASPSGSPSASPSSTPPGNAPKYSFEDGGLDGWSSTGNVTNLTNSTAVGGQDGSHALQVVFHSSSASDEPYIHVNPASGPTAGQTVSVYVYVPEGTASSVTAKLYVQDPAYTWHTASATTISQDGSWVRLSFTPTGYSGNAIQVGLQLQETPYGTPTTVYIDSVDWANTADTNTVTANRAMPRAAAAAAATDPTQTSYSLGVLVLKYFPLTADGQNIDINVTGDVGDPVASMRTKTDSITSNLVNYLSKGTQYHGYADSTAPASLTFHVVDTKEIDTAVPAVSNPFYSPPSNPYQVRPNYPQIMNSADICDYVDNRGVGEVWMYAYQGPSQLQIDESKMSGPNGDVSNEWTHDNLPVCNKTYTLYTFNYGRGTAEAFHSHAHQYEFELGYVDNQEYNDNKHLFNGLFEGDNYPQTHGVTGRCGSVHNPPNARNEYDWANTTPQASDCENWNPDSLGATTQISCTTWDLNNPGCVDNSDTDNSQLNYIVWWEQNFPGRGNTVTYQGKSFRNWWDVHGEWDAVVSGNLGLTLPPAPTQSTYSFEDGALDGWSKSGNVNSLANSSSVGGADGNHALAVSFHSTSTSDQPYVHVNPATGPTAGQTLSAYIYVPAGTSQTVTAKLYVQDSKFTWHTASATTVTQLGSWVHLTYTPSGYTGTAIQIGVQLSESAPFNAVTTVYLDAVGWT